MGRKTECAIAGKYMDVVVPEPGEDGAGIGGEDIVTFDGENSSCKFCKQGGDVSGTSPDFEDSILRRSVAATPASRQPRRAEK